MSTQTIGHDIYHEDGSIEHTKWTKQEIVNYLDSCSSSTYYNESTGRQNWFLGSLIEPLDPDQQWRYLTGLDNGQFTKKVSSSMIDELKNN